MANRKRNTPIRSKKFKRRKRNVNYNIQKPPPQDIRITCPAGEHDCTPENISCGSRDAYGMDGMTGYGWGMTVVEMWCTEDIHPCGPQGHLFKCCCPDDPFMIDPDAGGAGGSEEDGETGRGGR